jgi:hypothetical protein
MSKAGGMSISKAMGQWLGDTIDGAEYVTSKIEQARTAPKAVIQEMHAYSLALADEAGTLMDNIKEMSRWDRALAKPGRASGTRSADGRSPPLSPPSGNTGGKGLHRPPQQTQQSRASGAGK